MSSVATSWRQTPGRVRNGHVDGADRQLRIYTANRDIVEVTRKIAEATEAAPVNSVV